MFETLKRTSNATNGMSITQYWKRISSSVTNPRKTDTSSTRIISLKMPGNTQRETCNVIVKGATSTIPRIFPQWPRRLQTSKKHHFRIFVRWVCLKANEFSNRKKQWRRMRLASRSQNIQQERRVLVDLCGETDRRRTTESSDGQRSVLIRHYFWFHHYGRSLLVDWQSELISSRNLRHSLFGSRCVPFLFISSFFI